jgi:hypothetical protein
MPGRRRSEVVLFAPVLACSRQQAPIPANSGLLWPVIAYFGLFLLIWGAEKASKSLILLNR